MSRSGYLLLNQAITLSAIRRVLFQLETLSRLTLSGSFVYFFVIRRRRLGEKKSPAG